MSQGDKSKTFHSTYLDIAFNQLKGKRLQMKQRSGAYNLQYPTIQPQSMNGKPRPTNDRKPL